MYERWASDELDGGMFEFTAPNDAPAGSADGPKARVEEATSANPREISGRLNARRTFSMAPSDYPRRDDIINREAKKYRKRVGVWPTILAANTATFAAIDMVANQSENISGPDGE